MSLKPVTFSTTSTTVPEASKSHRIYCKQLVYSSGTLKIQNVKNALFITLSSFSMRWSGGWYAFLLGILRLWLNVPPARVAGSLKPQWKRTVCFWFCVQIFLSSSKFLIWHYNLLGGFRPTANTNPNLASLQVQDYFHPDGSQLSDLKRELPVHVPQRVAFSFAEFDKRHR